MTKWRIYRAFRHWISERFELSRGSRSNIRSMEGLRGFAALLVFFTHYCGFIYPLIETSSPFLAFIKPFDALGNTGVDLFFVLSGFLIYGALISRPQNFGHFMLQRVKRIYPVFLSLFLLYIPLSFIVSSENKIPSAPADAALYLLSSILLLTPLLIPFEPLINVAWSLSYEMFYYALIPLLIMTLRLRAWQSHWRIAFFSALALGYGSYCVLEGGKVRLIMFVAGILLYEVMKHTRLRAPSAGLTVFAVTTCLTSYLFATRINYSLSFALLFVAFFILCFCSFSDSSNWLKRSFEWSPLRWFGNMSYSFYMVHALAMQGFILIFTKVFPTAAPQGAAFFWIMMPVLFVVAFVPSLVIYLGVEYPWSLQKPLTTPATPTTPVPAFRPSHRSTPLQPRGSLTASSSLSARVVRSSSSNLPEPSSSRASERR